MVYSGVDDPDLPPRVRELTERLRDVWVRAFNAALAETGDEGEAMRTAYAALKAATQEAEGTPMKTEDGEQYPAEAFLYVPDREKPSTWKLRIWETPGLKVTRRQLGLAVAALSPAGLMGNRVEIPDEARPGILSRLRRLYQEIGVPEEDMPESIREAQEEKITEAVAVESVDGVAGKVCAITLIREGWSKNGKYYSSRVLQHAIPMYEGAQVFDNHQTEREYAEKPFRSVKDDLVGFIREVRWDDAARALRGKLLVVDDALRAKLRNAQELGVLPKIGLSHTIFASRRDGEAEGRRGHIVESIMRVLSVDIVANPSAGGAVEYVLAADSKEEREMQQNENRHDIVQPVASESGEAGCRPASDVAAEIEAARRELEAQKLEWKKLTCEALLDSTLARSQLPQPFKDHTRKQFENRVFEAGELQDWMAAMQKLWDETEGGAKVKDHGPIKITPQRTIENFWQKVVDLAFDDRLRHLEPETYRDIPYMRMSDAYVALTGDAGFEGRMDMSRVTEAEVTTSTLSNLVANALNKRLLRAYRARPRWWEPIVTRHSVDNLQDVRILRLGHISMIDTVAEGATYVEKQITDAYETASLQKYGNFIGVTEEAIFRDETQGIGQLADRLGQAAWKRVSYEIASLFSSTGPTLGDGYAWFDATNHLNYNATGSALSYTAFGAVRAALYKQRDMSRTSGGTYAGTAGQDELGFVPRYLLIPPDLLATAEELRTSELRPDTSYNATNAYRNTFDIVVVPNWTDTNDWVVMVDPTDVEILGMYFFRDQTEPQLFRADDNLVGAMFTNDEMRLKVKFRFDVAVQDFHGIYKCAVSS